MTTSSLEPFLSEAGKRGRSYASSHPGPRASVEPACFQELPHCHPNYVSKWNPGAG